MSQSIFVVDASTEENRELCAAISSGHYDAVSLQSLDELTQAVRVITCHALILDLDSLPLDNPFITRFHETNPTVCMILISSRKFHPELEEAIRNHISVCLSKPVNTDELIYWLRSVCGEGPHSRASPGEPEE